MKKSPFLNQNVKVHDHVYFTNKVLPSWVKFIVVAVLSSAHVA